MSPHPLDDSHRFTAKATHHIMTSTVGRDTCVPVDRTEVARRTEVDIKTARLQNSSLRLIACDI